ncbi:hypothetical protein HYFRA_00012595 [Hymenoscyphus fraxineus]|uniref:Reverse transcriptase RNase H-like domain-containing protein n=1 Tax=Hymenoscyphus fraxineus TaxID=746836 RepID=A0A9N9L831_9HELO|nr:hypothetical protein HYFRA_00012595 [Hymenoscyphus fraxineus]
MYSDASKFAGGAVITQKRRVGPPGDPGEEIEVPILFDAFTFTKTQTAYGTYKRELCAIVEFCRKFDYMFRTNTPAESIHQPHTPTIQTIFNSPPESSFAIRQ